MSMLVDIVAALLACGAATAWILSGREKLPPPNLDHLRAPSLSEDSSAGK
jgi:hypothetical protein